MKRKFFQLMLPFFVWGILITLYRGASYIAFLQDYWKFGYWYLLVLFEFYLLIYVSNKVNQHINKQNRWWIDITVFLSLWAILQLIARFIPAKLHSFTDYYQMLAYFPYFYIGVLMKQYRIIDFMLRHADILLAILTVVLIPLYMLWSHEIILSFINIILPFVIIFLLLLIFAKNETDLSKNHTPSIFAQANKILSIIGKHTMIIYMAQFFFFRYIDFSHWFGCWYKDENYIPILLVSLITSVIISYLCICLGRIIGMSRYLSFALLGKF